MVYDIYILLGMGTVVSMLAFCKMYQYGGVLFKRWNALIKLVVDKPHYNKMKLLGKGQSIRLVTAVRCAIKIRLECNTTNPVASLRHDIQNSIHHIFGRQERCSVDYCEVQQSLQTHTVSVTSRILDEMKSEYLEREVKVTMDHSRQIEQCTRGQSSSEKWYTHRHKGLTSSRFGDVMKRRLKTPVNPLVRSILYPSFKGNKYTRHGLSQEKYSIVHNVHECWQVP